jgi:hypothetical protein
MPMTLEEALKTALDDEYKARATYRAVLDAFGDVRPFANIVESEQRHIEALTRLFERHGLRVPADPWPERVSAPDSLASACAAAVEGERENAALYERLMAAAEGHADVQATFGRLLAASQNNHLPAFERCLEREQHGGGRRGRGGAHGPGHGRRHRYRGGRGPGPAANDP